MDGILAQEKVYKGYAIAAKKIGLVYTQYRSTTGIDPISMGNIVSSTFYASFNVSWDYMKSSKYGNAVFQCVADGRILQVGDYLVDSTKTWFIIGMENLLPILAVECNATVTVEHPQFNVDKGIVPYMGDQPTVNGTIFMQNIPCSFLIQGRGKSNETKLPMDSSWGRWEVLMPYLGNQKILVGDTVSIGTDIYIVDDNELTEFGWRLRVKRTVV